jgi:hypothetical protein
MVNGRMRANGATVKMAVGGLAIGNFGDVTKVDGIIKQLMTAANKDPALMKKLSSKGIMVNKTGADKKSAEMQQANKPQEPIEAAEGTYVNPFDFKKYGTLGSQLSNFDEEMVIESFKNPEGEIKQIILIDAYGNEIPVAWNTAMEIPEGFTRKDSDVLGELTPEVSPVSIASEAPRKLDSRAGEKTEGELDFERRVAANRVNSVSSNPSDGGFNWDTASEEDINKRLKNNKYMRMGTSIVGLLAGLAPPVALAINIANGAYNRAENENAKRRLDQLKQESGENWNPLAMDSPEYKDEDGKFDKAKYRKATKQLTDPLQKAQSELTLRMKDASLPSKNIGEAFSGGTSIKGIIQDTIKSISDVFVGGVYDAFGDTRKAANTTLGEPVVGSKSGLEKVTQLQKSQQLATNARLAREERDRQARETAEAAARASAQVSANAERVRGNTGSYYTGDTGSSGERYFNTSGGGGGYTDSSGTNQYLGGGDQGWTNPTNEKEMAARSSARAVSRGATSAPTRSDGKYSGSGRATGGLVSAPVAKQKKKKQTTQRRKGLGTRP